MERVPSNSYKNGDLELGLLSAQSAKFDYYKMRLQMEHAMARREAKEREKGQITDFMKEEISSTNDDDELLKELESHLYGMEDRPDPLKKFKPTYKGENQFKWVPKEKKNEPQSFEKVGDIMDENVIEDQPIKDEDLMVFASDKELKAKFKFGSLDEAEFGKILGFSSAIDKAECVREYMAKEEIKMEELWSAPLKMDDSKAEVQDPLNEANLGT
ncbi:hypothetical protein FNV43_RR10469 [Rhamnella rubrinervis]|uniref:Uncharacterized protein n=1 Tax=Rhamnella rubrinervis TaxID=2594499 RepID=A0A8K0ML63_9ROSA|nr:hypothetical protein FNV43_RR10469 [Rhamnella rubrinervis]